MADIHEVSERATEARSIVNSSVFNDAFDRLAQEYAAQLIQEDIGSLTAAAAHARMKVLAEVKASLISVINDEKLFPKKVTRNVRRY